ncbi:MAG: hypothetical protein COT85_00980 [Chlamydiae bacterium CG10_big_fil_rev_8_21_14_0_10_42_34]|nr:MAG: hypothetical protein COT85_00980 [Chlamydiae bacterium CG10_big_fil_rev_8_21_14_0_10_42_34]
MIEESYFDDLDRDLFDISSKMSDVFSWTYGMLGYRLVAPLEPNKFDNASSKIKEIGIRTLIVLGAVLGFCFAGTYIALSAAVLSLGSKVFRSAGFYFQKDGFTRVKGKASEVELIDGKATVMTWNIRGHGGGLHYDHGVIHWSARVDRIVEKIQKENADVIVLQEVYDTALVETLIAKLGDSYANFFTHCGESGCMVISKCAVHNFAHQEFNNNSKVARGFECLEIKAFPDAKEPCARIIGTQLVPDANAQKLRVEQVAQIVDSLASKALNLPTLFVGSLHLDREADKELLSKYLYHSYRETGPTHSHELVSQWAPVFDGQERSSDFISFFKRNVDGMNLPVVEKGISLLESHLVEGFDADYSTKTALSDHHAIVTTFSGLKGR